MAKWYRKELTDTFVHVNGGPFDPSKSFDRAALFLLGAVAARTTNYTKIASYTGLHHHLCRAMGERARETGIFYGYRLSAGDWLDPEKGGLSFILDAMVLDGTLECVPAEGRT